MRRIPVSLPLEILYRREFSYIRLHLVFPRFWPICGLYATVHTSIRPFGLPNRPLEIFYRREFSFPRIRRFRGIPVRLRLRQEHRGGDGVRHPERLAEALRERLVPHHRLVPRRELRDVQRKVPPDPAPPPDEAPLSVEDGRVVHEALQVFEKRAEAHHVGGGALRPRERLAELFIRRAGVERAALEELPPLPGESVAPGELPLVVAGALEAPDVPVDLPPHDPDREGSPHEERVGEEVRHVLPVGAAAPPQVALQRARHVPDGAPRAVRLPPERPPVLLGVETEDRLVEPREEPRRTLRERPLPLRRHGHVYATPREISLYCLFHAAELYQNPPEK